MIDIINYFIIEEGLIFQAISSNISTNNTIYYPLKSKIHDAWNKFS